MSDEIVRKPDKDFSKEVDKQIPEAEKLAKVCHVVQKL
jgi:26S proteasome regulatory subunit N5